MDKIDVLDDEIARSYGARAARVLNIILPAEMYPTGRWPQTTPNIGDVPKPTTDPEADEWIAATIQALDKKGLEKLYRMLYNAGYRVNA
jgi:hypothetical protein